MLMLTCLPGSQPCALTLYDCVLSRSLYTFTLIGIPAGITLPTTPTTVTGVIATLFGVLAVSLSSPAFRQRAPNVTSILKLPLRSIRAWPSHSSTPAPGWPTPTDTTASGSQLPPVTAIDCPTV